MRAIVQGLVSGATAMLLSSCGTPPIDSRVATEIANIRAIDNHAHPMRAVNAGEKDTEYDALPVDMMEAYDTVPLRARPNNPEYAGAQKVFGVDAARRSGDGYPSWVLDQMGIEIMFANRVTMGRGLPAARFKWVPYGDPWMYPLNNDSLGRHDPDRKAFFGAEEKLLLRFLKEGGAEGVPGSLDPYLRAVTAGLERWKKGGAVAVKLEMAYLRSFDVGNPSRADVERLFAKYAKTGVPSDAEYKSVQDFLFRHLAAECGRLAMPVHLHSSSGAGRYFDVAGVNPMLLLPVIIDMPKTNFVLIHGSWPYTRELTSILDKPNVYLDFSGQDLVLYPRALAEVLRGWLEYVPEKVLFGTDASPVNEQISWEQTGWLAATTGREGLGLALTGMLRDNEITPDRAIELARMVLRENARKLYGF